MPASSRRHNLQRLREHLGISQTTLAQWVGRTWSTIKAIETGKLTLSPRLATLISAETGADREWLLRNDLLESMPPLMHRSGRLRKEELAYDFTLILLILVFERLSASLRHLKPSALKSQTLEIFKRWLESMEKPEKELESDQEGLALYGGVRAAEYFKANPGQFDIELVNLLNAEYLVRSVHQQAEREKVENQLLLEREEKATRRRPKSRSQVRS